MRAEALWAPQHSYGLRHSAWIYRSPPARIRHIPSCFRTQAAVSLSSLFTRFVDLDFIFISFPFYYSDEKKNFFHEKFTFCAHIYTLSCTHQMHAVVVTRATIIKSGAPERVRKKLLLSCAGLENEFRFAWWNFFVCFFLHKRCYFELRRNCFFIFFFFNFSSVVMCTRAFGVRVMVLVLRVCHTSIWIISYPFTLAFIYILFAFHRSSLIRVSVRSSSFSSLRESALRADADSKLPSQKQLQFAFETMEKVCVSHRNEKKYLLLIAASQRSA